MTMTNLVAGMHVEITVVARRPRARTGAVSCTEGKRGWPSAVAYSSERGESSSTALRRPDNSSLS